MIKLSVSQAARMLGISRREIQQQINNGTLYTHEGYVTTDSIRLAYPKSNFYSEQDNKIKRYEQIQKDAVYKSAASEAIHNENEKILFNTVKELKEQLEIEKAKNIHFSNVFEDLTKRIKLIEENCSSKDKEYLVKLHRFIVDNNPQ